MHCALVVRHSKRRGRVTLKHAPVVAPVIGAEADAPRPRGTRAREVDVDIALHSIGLALDALLDDTRVEEVADPDAGAEDPVDELRSALQERFENADVDTRGLDVVIDGERVILLGIVGDPLSRLIAEDIVWSLPEVVTCENRLAVA